MDDTAWKRLTRLFPAVPAGMRVERRQDRAAPGQAIVAHDRPVLALAYSADGRWLAASGGGSIPGPAAIQVIDVEARMVRRVCHYHRAGVLDLAFDPVTGLLASASHDYTVVLWEVGERDDAIVLTGGPDTGISRHRVAFVGSQVVVGDGETFRDEHASLTAFDLDDGSVRTLLALPCERWMQVQEGVRALDTLPDGGGLVVLTDLFRERDSPTVRMLSPDGDETARWEPDDDVLGLVATSADRIVALVQSRPEDESEPTTLEVVAFDAGDGTRQVSCRVSDSEHGVLCRSPRRERIAVGHGHCVQLFDSRSLGPGARFVLGEDRVTSVAWSPAADLVAAGTLSGRVHLFDVGVATKG